MQKYTNVRYYYSPLDVVHVSYVYVKIMYNRIIYVSSNDVYCTMVKGCVRAIYLHTGYPVTFSGLQRSFISLMYFASAILLILLFRLRQVKLRIPFRT